MLYRGDIICDFHLNASDGRAGKIKDILFDELSWTVRYFVVDTGSWLNGREVLISPIAITGLRADDRVFTTDLTQKQIEDSPTPESDLPVSKQYYERLQHHYGWNPYWGSIFPFEGMYTYPMGAYSHQNVGDQPLEKKAGRAHIENHGDIHLRSVGEVSGYEILAVDGIIGDIVDVLIDTQLWRVTHFIADTSKWWFGNYVVIDKGAIGDIRWTDKRIEIDLCREDIKSSPAYQQGMSIGEAYQRDLSRYYARMANQTKAARQRGIAHEDLLRSNLDPDALQKTSYIT